MWYLKTPKLFQWIWWKRVIHEKILECPFYGHRFVVSYIDHCIAYKIDNTFVGVLLNNILLVNIDKKYGLEFLYIYVWFVKYTWLFLGNLVKKSNSLENSWVPHYGQQFEVSYRTLYGIVSYLQHSILFKLTNWPKTTVFVPGMAFRPNVM